MTFQPALEKAIMNDEWITNGEVPDPDVLPDKFKDDMKYLTTVGRVVKLGKLAYLDNTKFPEGPWCAEGEYVCYGRHTGQRFVYKGIRYILMYDDQVLMKIEDPKDVDPSHELIAA